MFYEPVLKPMVSNWVKPICKPMVSVRLNPCAKSGLTLKQNKTIQDRVGFVLKTKPTHLLVSQPNKQGSFSCFFFLRALPKRTDRRFRTVVFNMFSTEFSTLRIWR